MEAEERREFNRIVTEVLDPSDGIVSFRHGTFGHYAKILNITGDIATSIEYQLDAVDGIETARTEASDGLVMEVFSTESFK